MDVDTLYVLDGSSLCYRAFFAINLSSSKGFPTGAIYGFYNTLRKIQKKFRPQYLVVCFDVSRKTFRQEKFKEYKITRPPVPDSLKAQLPRIKELLSVLHITICEQAGYEADDLIWSIVKKYPKRNIVIITSDKDLYQLIQKDRVTVYDPVKDEHMNEKGFVDKFGFAPKNMADYLAICGDASDNIPGAKGIGKVTATKLVGEYRSVEQVFAHLSDMPKSLREKLITSEEDVLLSKELVTLAEVTIDSDLNDFRVRQPDEIRLKEMCQEFEFKSFLKEMAAKESGPSTVQTESKLSASTKEAIRSQGKCVFFHQEDTIYLLGSSSEKVYEVDCKLLADIFSDNTVTKITYDSKSLFHRLSASHRFSGEWFDVRIAGYLLASHLGDFSLENLLAHFLNEFTGTLSSAQYPEYIFRLYEVLKKQLNVYALSDLFSEIEMPLVGVLAAIETEGIHIDKKFLKSFSQEVKTKVESLRTDIFSHSQGEFNLNSPKQLQKILFEKLKLPPVKKTKTGYSTNEEVLLKLKKKHPIIPLLLDYREYNKLHSTYLLPFLKQVENNKGIIHAQFNQTGTQTGRLSSSSPNMQNLPARSEFAQRFRKAFIPSSREGIILSCDYSQIELRILAHFSGDKNLCDAFNNNLDIHRFTAALLFDRREEKVSNEQRDIAKMVNFGIIYGMSAFRLAKEMHMSLGEAEGFIASYFSRYPGVKEFIEKIYREVEETGYVKTLLGRIRFLPDIKSPYRDIKEFAHRQAVNTPIQGTAADIIKMAMVRIYREMNDLKLRSRMIAQIHDELIFDVDSQEFEEIKQIAREIMEGVIPLNVPLKVNVKKGPDWFALKAV